jgi:hypothetical protein
MTQANRLLSVVDPDLYPGETSAYINYQVTRGRGEAPNTSCPSTDRLAARMRVTFR